ncbi:FAD-dependent monooxygenase, partial [Mycobacterium kansasii]
QIVPAPGAKGLNLASFDVVYLSDSLPEFYKSGGGERLKGYSDRALAYVWKLERFSWYLTKLMHHYPENDALQRRMQVAQLENIAGYGV